MAVLSKTFFPLVRVHLMSFAFFSTRHNAIVFSYFFVPISTSQASKLLLAIPEGKRALYRPKYTFALSWFPAFSQVSPNRKYTSLRLLSMLNTC
jgi:ribonuclease I